LCPSSRQQDALVIAVSDPSRLMVLDEIAGLLAHRIIARVATLSQITDLLKKTEQSQRVLDEASEGLTFDVLTGDDNSDENISIEKLTSEEDISPIIRLVDTTIFTALERRASDIHIETNDDSVVVKYRIDGVLAGGDGAHCARASLDDPEPHQDHERAGHRRAESSAGWALQGSLQGQAHRLPRLHHAHNSRRKRRAPCA
jgi:type II secretory ATPase GspE/PulE/Tfp pilus assembly ATPase PilB-like protein